MQKTRKLVSDRAEDVGETNCGLRLTVSDYPQRREMKMTVYEKIKDLDEEKMAEFLLKFAKDTINQFDSFIMPDIDRIRKFLELEFIGN